MLLARLADNGKGLWHLPPSLPSYCTNEHLSCTALRGASGTGVYGPISGYGAPQNGGVQATYVAAVIRQYGVLRSIGTLRFVAAAFGNGLYDSEGTYIHTCFRPSPVSGGRHVCLRFPYAFPDGRWEGSSEGKVNDTKLKKESRKPPKRHASQKDDKRS